MEKFTEQETADVRTSLAEIERLSGSFEMSKQPANIFKTEKSKEQYRKDNLQFHADRLKRFFDTL